MRQRPHTPKKKSRSTFSAACLASALLIIVELAAGLVACSSPAPTRPDRAATQGPLAEATPRLGGETQRSHLPLVLRQPSPSPPTPTPTPSPRPSPVPTPLTPTPTPIDFDAVRASLQAQGRDLAFVKIGFHVGPAGNAHGLGEYLRSLANAGVPAFLKCVDDYSPCAEALDYNPDNITVFRLTSTPLGLPDYELPAETSAEEHWARILSALPPAFDQRTWLEVMNEPDKERADWLGRFASRTAHLALRDGYRFAAFGWSSGEPEPEDWETPGMLDFLNLASQHPTRIGVALHEYSFTTRDIQDGYPVLVGRFQTLFEVCDQNDILRPTVLITEWGWEYQNVPYVDNAMDDIAWASRLYAAYPQVQGAATWYLGGGYAGIANQTQQLIAPLRDYALRNYFVVDQTQQPIDPSRFQSR